LFGGKEEQTSLGLQWLDFGQRYYDPVVARFLQIDPVTQLLTKYSPYSYSLNNPVRFSDPTGMIPVDAVERDSYWHPGCNCQVNRMGNYWAGGSEQDTDQNGPNDDFLIRRDGTIVRTEATEDEFHRYLNENGDLVYQTNWTESDVINAVANRSGVQPAIDFWDDLMILARASVDDELNQGSVTQMYDRAGELGWVDVSGITRLRVLGENAYSKDLAAVVWGLLDPISLVRANIGTPLSQVFRLLTGQPVSNFVPWLVRKVHEPGGDTFDWNNQSHLNRLDKR
jgi:RHS repeat-associated protein